MKPYKRRSLYQYKFIRKIRYGRGHGVHSPLAFQIIQNVIQPYGRYYAEDDYWIKDNELLLFRMIARRNPQTLHVISDEMINTDMLLVAKSDLCIVNNIDQCSHRSLLYTDKAEVAINFCNKCKGDIILTRIRENSSSEKKFEKFISNIKSGIVIDLYDTALFVYINDVVYLYRSTKK
ncbi:hypothetical protein QYZ87_09415 [Porphyromonadaceae bacterium W3.11]|nr:hypothetical protein [Porphyromonadaceae bacterium W3.11]